ncbi:hypothetical protein [Streptomyces sp. NRRL F-5123]|uniref:hypothetical protein n=1 Tax=Streptomyces sp. NRRL F-5123 TaxID=1463856 RepID=UPI0004E1035A|nr:hypothetical protein [Streptomyces sp. NRRL F-5123]
MLGTGPASLIPTGSEASAVNPVAAAAGRCAIAQLLQVRVVAVPVPVVTAAAELLGLLAGHPYPRAQAAVEAVPARLHAAVDGAGTGLKLG